MIRVAALTQGVDVPGSRFRVRQYLPHLPIHGVEMSEFVAKVGSYPPESQLQRPVWALHTLFRRAGAVIKSHAYDMTFFQRELLSTYYTMEGLTKKPRVLDVDDAIWLNKRVDYAEKLARSCSAVICGQEFLAEQFSKWNSNIHILPTAVDDERFVPLISRVALPPTLGWTGGSGALHELYAMEDVFKTVLNIHKDARLRILCDKPPKFTSLPHEQVEYVQWSQDVEVKAIQGMTVGIMPMKDTDWNRGKCSYKMLLYMSCGVPVVVSPVGMNETVLKMDRVGIGASTHTEWIEALDYMLTQREKATEVGIIGRKLIEDKFGLKGVSMKLAEILKKIANSKK